ncbi:MAG: hypothetical protein KAI02_05250 [Gammaproteobacteria bacterium]|nr:hypothetical protein [Gammaproteobacteria bacterium]
MKRKNKVVIPERWKTSDKQIKKMQLAFEFEDLVEKQLKQDALDNGISASSQLRKILNLHYESPLKPRLSVTLSVEDREILAQRYAVKATDRAYIRLGISREIETYYHTLNNQ